MAIGRFTAFEPNVSFRYILTAPAFNGIKFLCKAISLPKIDQGEVVIDYVNTDFKVKGKSRWQDITLQIYDAVGGEGTNKAMGAKDIHKWLLKHHDSENGQDGWAFGSDAAAAVAAAAGAIGGAAVGAAAAAALAPQYKHKFTIEVLNPKGNRVYDWELHGAFMSSIDFGEMDWAAEDAVIANVTIKYDWAKYNG